MTRAREGHHASVIYDVPEPRPVPLPDMICASPTGVTGPLPGARHRGCTRRLIVLSLAISANPLRATRVRLSGNASQQTRT